MADGILQRILGPLMEQAPEGLGASGEFQPYAGAAPVSTAEIARAMNPAGTISSASNPLLVGMLKQADPILYNLLQDAHKTEFLLRKGVLPSNQLGFYLPMTREIIANTALHPANIPSVLAHEGIHAAGPVGLNRITQSVIDKLAPQILQLSPSIRPAIQNYKYVHQSEEALARGYANALPLRQLGFDPATNPLLKLITEQVLPLLK